MLQFAFVLLLAAPARSQDPAPPAPAEVAHAAKVAAASRIAERLLAAADAGDLASFQECLDLETLAGRILREGEATDEMRERLLSELRKELAQRTLAGLHGRVTEGGDLRLLRVREREGELRPLIRLVRADGALDYMELSLQFSPEGAPRIRDWSSFALGEWVSETVRHVYLPLAAEANRGLLDRLFGSEQLIVKHWSKIHKLSECAQKRDLEGGRAIWTKLPEALQHDKFILLQRLVLVTSSDDDAEYMRVLEDLRRYYPDDASSELHAIDWHYMRKEYELARKSLARLGRSVGGDPYLDFLEASLLTEMRDYAAARLAIARSLEAEPGRKSAHWVCIDILTKLHDHPATLEALKRLDRTFEMEWNDLGEVEEFREFAASEQHKQWLAYLAAKR